NMNTLKMKFKMENAKEKTLSIKNVKATALEEDIKALGNYIAQNQMLNYAGVKITEFMGAVLVNTKETKINA
ncbi:MAG: DUF2922 domain-containing protein, partial [Erysipelotrichaceae bacterium]|nr:DUF2922 domain-containing protein [Erysipelotrichaceae bacterium]